MPSIEEHFTTCADPGEAHEFSVGENIALFLLLGGLQGFIAWVTLKLLGAPCSVAVAIVWGAVLGLVSELGLFNDWYYEKRLMCIRRATCAAGLLVGRPFAACDGDRKVDLLLSPFGLFEVEADMAWAAANALSSAGGGFPAPPPRTDYLASRSLRLEYVNGVVGGSGPQLAPGARLSDDHRKQLYFEIVHKYMFTAPQPGAPDRTFQSHFHIRDAAAMGNAAFANSDDDSGTDGNPMYRFEHEPVSGPGFVGTVFCDWLLGHPSEEAPEPRIVPYLHCEIEGNRLDRGIFNLMMTLLAFAGGYTAACIVCSAYLGDSPWCAAIALVVAAILAVLAWLLMKWLNDPEDGEADAVSIDVPAPNELNDAGWDEDAGDLVLVVGDWIMDVEHDQYFEIHPVTSWYRVAVGHRGMRLIDDPSELAQDERFLMTTEVTADRFRDMCAVASGAELYVPDPALTGTTAKALTMARAIE